MVASGTVGGNSTGTYALSVIITGVAPGPVGLRTSPIDEFVQNWYDASYKPLNLTVLHS